MKKNPIHLIFVISLTFLCVAFLLNFPPFPKRDFKLGLDLKGGVHLEYQADLSQIAEKERKEIMAGLRDVIEKRINLLGVAEPMVQTTKERLIVEIAGTVDPGEAIKEIGKTPYLEFREQKENFEEIMKRNEEGQEYEDPFKPTQLTGRYLKGAYLEFDSVTQEPVVSLEFNKEGAKIFEELTEKNVGKILAIYLDGKPISLPVVREKISGGKAQITGNFTVEEAKELVRNLNIGALPAPIKLIYQKSVGPTLGKEALEKMIFCGLLGFLAIILFMIFYYRFFGILASFSLMIYVLILLTLFKLIPVTLTLAGIAGFLLSTGMAVDANVLIFSRMREELREKKSFSHSLKEGFERAWPSIRDGNFTTLIATVVLFIFGESFVRGFALTLGLGILISLFSAIFVTRIFLNFCPEKIKEIKKLW
jgi:protein-export membrane protein SecD